jgi:hypothetical protein
MQQHGSSSLISCEKQTIWIEFLTLQGKPKHTMWRGTPSPHTSIVPVDSLATKQGSPPWHTMPHWPRLSPCSDRTCTHHIRNRRPCLRTCEERSLQSRLTQVLGLPIFTIFIDMCLIRSNAWHTVPHINPYSNFRLVDNASLWIIVHRPSSFRYQKWIQPIPDLVSVLEKSLDFYRDP